MQKSRAIESLHKLSVSADKLASILAELKDLAGKSLLSPDALHLVEELASVLHPDSELDTCATSPLSTIATAFATNFSLSPCMAEKVIELVPLPLFVKDCSGRLLFVNKAYENFFGLRREDVLGKPLGEMGDVPCANTDLHHNYDCACIDSGSEQRYEAQFTDQKGVVRTCLFYKTPLSDSNGEVLGIIGGVSEVTEYCEQKNKIESVESRLKRITDTVPVVVFQCEILGNEFRYTYVSEQVREMRGLAPADVLASSQCVLNQIIKEDRSSVQEGILTVRQNQKPWQSEYRIRLPDGSIRWIRGGYVPDKQLTRQGACRVTGIWQNVTHERQMSALLHEVTDNIPVVVFQCQRMDEAPYVRFTFASRVIEKMFGIAPEEVLQNTESFLALIHPDDQHFIVETLEDYSAGKEIRRFEFRVQHKNTAKTMWIRAEAMPRSNADKYSIWNGYFTDFTEAKQISDELVRAKLSAETASKSKSEFLANMSHEIRTPMNGVIGMTDLVLDTDLTEEQREYLLIAKSSADSLMTIINDILDFSKIEAGKLLIEHISFNILRTVDDTLKTLALRAHDKGLELVCDVEPDVPIFVMGDPGRLRQILVNLINNAIKFTDKGEVVLSVVSEKTFDNEVLLRFSVKDSGIGISKEKLTTIFEAFSQEDGSITRKYGGTGLGLTISSHLVEALGGHIWVDSELGKGSTFHFTSLFPIDTQQHESAVDSVDFAGKLMLVVDDNPVNRLVMVRTLSRAGIAVREVNSGLAALEMLAKPTTKPFDLVLMDANMPEMDGFTTTEKILQLPNCTHLKVIMLSSGGIKGDGQLCREIGFAAYLPKPVSRVELFNAMGRVLSMEAPRENNDVPMVTRHFLKDISDVSLDVLLVEDHPVNQKLAVNMLERWGHQATVAGNGQQAVDLVRSKRFDLVLMDMMMPVMDGLDATRLIRTIEQQNNMPHVPIIAMTANAMQGDREACIEAGMDDYLTKPIKTEDFQKVLAKYQTLFTSSLGASKGEACIMPTNQGRERSNRNDDEFDYANALQNVDQEMVELITDVFLEHCPDDLERIRDALTTGDNKLVTMVAHTLKGTLAIFGAQPAMQLASRLEKLAARGEPLELEALSLFEELATEIEQLCVVLKSTTK